LESFDEQMRFLLRYTVLAPSNRNSQPWEFRITTDALDVFADYSRRLPVIDPDDRELVMSVGAAITNFRVAAAHFGFESSVQYERSAEEQSPLARLSIRKTSAPDRDLAALFGAITKRHTNRALFDGDPLDPAAASQICDVVDRFPEFLRFMLSRDKRRTVDMIEEAERAQMVRPAFRAEIANLIASDEDRTDGLLPEAFAVPPILSADAAWVVRQFDIGVAQGHRDRGQAESASALLFVTADDDRVSLIQAGEALEILLLTIAGAGLQYSFLNQPVQVKEVRDRIARIAGGKHPPQLLIRVGNALPVREATPRRRVNAVTAPPC
ncbi:MAG: hypothetical protein QOK07_2464, partial [Gemmatimonadaceae bacterium]|nr:hypothetical protein [Gemmatimonadaceae bacterium]